jgi:hypothetical protein
LTIFRALWHPLFTAIIIIIIFVFCVGTQKWVTTPRRIRKELRKCISYRGNSVVSLVNQRINNGMYYRLHPKKNYPIILRHDD